LIIKDLKINLILNCDLQEENMMTLRKWLIGICLGLMVSFAQADTKKEQLELAESYNKQFMQYYKQGEWKKALPLAEKAFQIRKSLLGEKDPDTLTSLNNLAGIYQAVGHLNEALPLYEQGYSLSKEVLGAKHPQTLTSLNNLASIYDSVGRINEALPLYEQGYSLSKEVLGEKDPDTLISLNNLAAIYQAVGHLNEALPLFEQGYSLRKEVLGAKHPDTLSSLNNLAAIYKAVGRFNEALPLYEQGYSFSKHVLGAKHPDTLTSLNNLGGIYQAVGRFNEALPLYEQGYSLRKEVLGVKHPDTLTSLNNLASIYDSVGRLNEALPLLEQGYSLRKEVLGAKHPDTLKSNNNLAGIYYSVGRIGEALPLLEQGYSLRKEVLGAKHPDTLQSNNNLAGIYYSVGRIGEALPLLEQGYSLRKEVLGVKHPDTLQSNNNLAFIYKAVGRLNEALSLLEQGYSLRKEVLGVKHPDTLTSLNNLADIYDSVGRIEEALPLLEQGYSLRKEVLGAKHPQTLGSLNNLAGIYYSVGRLNEALPLYEQGYRLSKEVLGAKHPDTLGSLNNLAYTYAELGNIDKAIKLFEQSLQGVEALRNTGDLSAETRQTIFKQWIHGYFMLSRLYLIKNRLSDAFHTAEMTKARTLLDSMTSRLAAQQAGLSTIDLQKLQENQAKISAFNHQIAKASKLDKKLNLEMEKTQFLKQAAEFHRSLMEKYPRYAQLNDIQIANAKIGASLIPDDTLFVSYLIDKDNYVLVFTLDNTGNLQAYNLGIIPNLDQTLKTYNTVLGYNCKTDYLYIRCNGELVWQIADGSIVIGKKPARNKEPKKVKELEKVIRYLDKTLDNTSRYLAQKLLEPLKANLQTKKRWIISPDGALALIPFESLIFEDKPLIANYSVSYVQSLSVLKLLKEREKQYQSKNRDTLLAMGAARYELPDKKITNRNLCNKAKRAPNFNLETMLSGNDPQSYQRAINSLDINWCNLPGSEKELRELEKLFNKKSLWLRIKSLFVTTKTEKSLFLKNQQASEAKLQSLNKNNILTNYKYILLSAHGYLNTETPALSAIVLDQQNKTPNTDGYITASEWPSYNLKSDLMVLSACQTANGKIVRGEGIIGLPYALYVAGNKNTLMTLWSVIDHSTADFTISFFSKLKQGMGQVEALTETKREFLKSEKYKRPLYWAGFVLYGI
jgi:CHAT domain-containing protein/predicted transporter